MAKILVAFDTVQEGFESLEREHDLIRPPQGRDFTQDELAKLIVDADILCSVFDIPITAELMSKGQQLKLVANYAVGYNNIDIEYAKANGITVTNTPKAVVEPTAELAMSLLLACSRRTAELDRLVRQKDGSPRLSRIDRMGLDLYGKTVGIVGYGNIGSAVAKRCLAFGMNVLYYKRTPLAKEEEKRLGIEYAELEDLLQRSDVVSLHTPYSKASHHQINGKAINQMKDGAILINTARGSIVDEDALILALKSGKLFAAGLDVFEDNDVPRKELIDLDNVVMTPHVGTQTYDARRQMAEEVSANIQGFLSGRKDISRVV